MPAELHGPNAVVATPIEGHGLTSTAAISAARRSHFEKLWGAGVTAGVDKLTSCAELPPSAMMARSPGARPQGLVPEVLLHHERAATGNAVSIPSIVEPPPLPGETQ
jgi:hypothetical protein